MTDPQTDLTPEERQLLTNIRRRPATYLGKGGGMRELAHFLHGYEVAMLRHNVKGVRLLPRGFRDYVCLRLKGDDPSGWLDALLLHEPDDRRAMEAFWQLLDEYLTYNEHEPIPAPPPERQKPRPDGILRVTRRDLGALAASYMRTFNGAPWWDRWTPAAARRRMRELLELPGSYGLAAWQEQHLLGAVLGRTECYYDRRCFQIIELWVDPAAQRQGLGRQLLAGLRQCKPDERLFLITMHGEATEGFYEANGFVTQDDLCVMQLSPKTEA